MASDDFPYTPTAQTPGWLIAEPLDPAVQQQIGEFNRRGILQLLEDISISAPIPLRAGEPLPAVLQLTKRWQALDAVGVSRLAAMPYLLFDLGFDAPELFAVSRLNSAVVDPSERAQFVRTVLHYAWHLARANPLGAAVGLGMPSRSCAVLRELGFGELESLVPRFATRLRLRWANRVAVWRALLDVAQSGEPAALEHEQLSGLRRLAGDLLATSSTGAAARPMVRAAGRIEDPLW